ncbi:MAG: hypothetical protein NC182_05635 [Prevotella sp.]|nr:hypothetical protein [Staphylococcus sp.]MCM1260397.1 hypothetical protein [Staphylococcus sp.]MCM1349889.1 hypothetical protein [Prevotella sp.]MCM1350665.1 hypothetical protein [Prevotella sp.]
MKNDEILKPGDNICEIMKQTAYEEGGQTLLDWLSLEFYMFVPYSELQNKLLTMLKTENGNPDYIEKKIEILEKAIKDGEITMTKENRKYFEDYTDL